MPKRLAAARTSTSNEPNFWPSFSVRPHLVQAGLNFGIAVSETLNELPVARDQYLRDRTRRASVQVRGNVAREWAPLLFDARL